MFFTQLGCEDESGVSKITKTSERTNFTAIINEDNELVSNV